jgi:hypothetical protein
MTSRDACTRNNLLFKIVRPFRRVITTPVFHHTAGFHNILAEEDESLRKSPELSSAGVKKDY